MFGPPSLSKLVILVLIVAAVWGAFSLIGRLQQARREEERRMAAQPRPRANVAKVEDMVLCRSCGAYYAPSVTHNCSRGAGRA
jgi:hypothetical protein